ncbi:tetraphosphate phosphorylase 2 (ATP adenylyltransferase) [Phlyctema vagabunda]|uniref:Tetraphosphate phosphorylase 2 (ATP adenylyltransferase) n=1 Tax=Phlyctema vagabunda TaxID=108571 RepID=A0ABR4PHC3_9HELO
MEEHLILSKFDGMVKSGLVLYDEKQETIEHIDAELKFHFILTSALAKKPTIHTPQPRVEDHPELYKLRRDGSDISTDGFELGDVGNTHFLAANKFCFARPHLMLLTSDGHRRQYEALDESDLSAALTSINAFGKDYAVFYNCGQDGGCSRLHKHMQLLPMPKDSFAAFLNTDDGSETSVPFAWFYHRFEDQQVTPTSLVMIYNELLRQADRVGHGRSENADKAPPGAACPHNVIFTKRWIVVIPRRQAGISKQAGANAMGMLGYIATATTSEMDNWTRLRLTETLEQLGVPR